VGLKCVPENSAVVAKMAEGGLLVVACGDNMVRLVPPLIIEEAHIDEAMAIMNEASTALAKEA